MIVVKTSIKKARAEINETAKRLIIFAIVMGLTSEIFLIIVLRKMILKPIGTLNKGGEILKAGKLDHRIELKKEKIYGCLRCDVFPVLGVLVTGKKVVNSTRREEKR